MSITWKWQTLTWSHSNIGSQSPTFYKSNQPLKPKEGRRLNEWRAGSVDECRCRKHSSSVAPAPTHSLTAVCVVHIINKDFVTEPSFWNTVAIAHGAYILKNGNAVNFFQCLSLMCGLLCFFLSIIVALMWACCCSKWLDPFVTISILSKIFVQCALFLF